MPRRVSLARSRSGGPAHADCKAAVLSSPKVSASEAEVFAAMKNISEHALRAIGARREWTRHLGVASNLVRNPRTPVDVSVPFVPRLSVVELKALAKERNVSEAIRGAAKRFFH